jgi:hypothetical protein
MSKANKPLEKELYKPIKEHLEARFKRSFGGCYMEITSEGTFSQAIQCVIAHDIIFSFLSKQASPDLVGFTWEKERQQADQWLDSVATSMPTKNSDIKDFITVEIKRDAVTIQNVYQAKMYGDLFQAKYALLVSPKPIPEKIKRVHKQLSVLGRFMSGWHVYLGQWNAELNDISSWFPKSPFPTRDSQIWLDNLK